MRTLFGPELAGTRSQSRYGMYLIAAGLSAGPNPSRSSSTSTRIVRGRLQLATERALVLMTQSKMRRTDVKNSSFEEVPANALKRPSGAFEASDLCKQPHRSSIALQDEQGAISWSSRASISGGYSNPGLVLSNIFPAHPHQEVLRAQGLEMGTLSPSSPHESLNASSLTVPSRN